MLSNEEKEIRRQRMKKLWAEKRGSMGRPKKVKE